MKLRFAREPRVTKSLDENIMQSQHSDGTPISFSRLQSDWLNYGRSKYLVTPNYDQSAFIVKYLQ
jgi:hypothetical protein